MSKPRSGLHRVSERLGGGMYLPDNVCQHSTEFLCGGDELACLADVALFANLHVEVDVEEVLDAFGDFL